MNDLDLNNSYTYGMDRQHTYTSLSTTLPNFSTLVDNNSVNKFLSYNFSLDSNTSNFSNLNNNRLNYESTLRNTSKHEDSLINVYKLMHTNNNLTKSLDFSTFLKIPNIVSILSTENDSKQYSNSFKFILNFKHKKKNNTKLKFTI
jgi:hypothetical protein